jgi:pimeloyl-ACP methyl ester carboxylesterase
MQEETIGLSHGKVRCWTGGEGRALLLLHSAWGDAEFSWSRVWEPLSASYRVFAPDLPGFGGSAPLDDPSPANLAALFSELLDAQGVAEAVVVGNSLSAFLALHFAEICRGRVAKLVLVNGLDFPVIPARLRKLLGARLARSALTSVWARTMLTWGPMIRPSFSPRSGLRREFFDQITRNPRARAHAATLVGAWLKHAKPAAPPEVPLALIWGTDDKPLPIERARKIAEWARGGVVLPIENAGHMPQVEQPGEFVKALVGFIG